MSGFFPVENPTARAVHAILEKELHLNPEV